MRLKAFVWFVLFAVVSCSNGDSKERERRVAELEREVDRLNSSLGRMEFERDQAVQQIRATSLHGERQLQEVYPALKRFPDNGVIGSLGYIDSIYVSPNGKIEYRFHNQGGNNIKPNFHIYFLNDHGFVTGTDHVFWAFTSIGPNEARTDTGNTRFRFGAPVYYFVEFE